MVISYCRMESANIVMSCRKQFNTLLQFIKEGRLHSVRILEL